MVFRYYWMCLKHFGKDLWSSKGRAIMASFSGTVLGVIIGLLQKEPKVWATAKNALIFTLALFGITVLLFAIRAPWAVQDQETKRESIRLSQIWGIFGASILALVITGIAWSIYWLHVTHRDSLSVVAPAPPSLCMQSQFIEVDRVDYQKEKQLADRKHIENWIVEGNQIKNESVSLTDSPGIEGRVYGWRTEIIKLLPTLGNGSYSISSSANPDPLFSGTLSGKPISPLNSRMWNIANDVTSQLEQILGKMPWAASCTLAPPSKLMISPIDQMWSAIPASIAGVTRNV